MSGSLDDGRPLHVVVVIDGLGWGGAEMLLAEFVHGARAVGVRVDVVYLRDTDRSPAAARLVALGVVPVLLPMSGPMGTRVLPRLRAHLRRLQPDVVHTHLGYADVLAGLAARSLGIPVVSTLHVVTPPPERGAKARTQHALFSLARRRGASVVLAVSEAARRGYLAVSGDAPGHTRVVHNGVVGRPADGQGPAARRELGLAPEDLVVVMVSVLRPGKGHDLALEAVRLLRPRWPRLRLVVLGAGPLAGELSARAAPLGDAVVLAGHRDDVPRVLDAADVLLHPSEQDAFPTALLEAMAAQVPVLATAVGGIPEIVAPGRTGVLVPAPTSAGELAQALDGLLADPALRRRLGRAGRERFAACFSAATWAQRTRDTYLEVLAARRRRPLAASGASR